METTRWGSDPRAIRQLALALARACASPGRPDQPGLAGAAHRTIWLRTDCDQGGWYVLDGTHRLVALAWHFLLEERPWPRITALACGRPLPTNLRPETSRNLDPSP